VFSLLLFLSCYGDPSYVSGGADALRFAGQVIAYKPAPGQYTGLSAGSKALGAPDGSIVTLGDFGGSITLRMSSSITDRAEEADFVIWGNAFYIGGDPRSRWAEPGLVEVSPDNVNWYLIGGSLFNAGNRPAANLLIVTYSNTNNFIWPPWLNGYSSHSVTNYSLNSVFTQQLRNRDSAYTNSTSDNVETLYGFADCTPKGEVGEDWVADDPLQFGIETSGGDPIMLEWAVDSSGNSIYSAISNLSFRYIRITTAVQQASSRLGERSTEIDAVGICQ